MDLATLKATYVSNPATLMADSAVTPLLDAQEYFQELDNALALVGQGTRQQNEAADEFVFISGFWLAFHGGRFDSGDFLGDPTIDTGTTTGPKVLLPFNIPTPSGRSLLEILEEKAVKGVDVRIMGWAHYALVKSIGQGVTLIFPGGIAVGIEPFLNWEVPTSRINAFTVDAIQKLRSGPIGSKAIVNVLNHGGGSSHAKLVVVGRKVGAEHQATAFTGGVDLVSNRWSQSDHAGEMNLWHDVVAKVEGRAAQSVHDMFRDVWNGNLALRGFIKFNLGGETIDHRLLTTPIVPNRSMAPVPGGQGTHHAQSLATYPARNHRAISRIGALNLIPRPVPWFWDDRGVFEAATGLQKAIGAATRYIYIEDQYLWSLDVFRWLRAALVDQARPDLRVIMLTSGGDDEDDPEPSTPYRNWHIHQYLLPGLTQSQGARVRLFKRWGDVIDAVDPDFEITSVSAKLGTTDLQEVTSNTAFDVDLAQDQFGSKNLEIHQGTTRVRVVGNGAIDKGNAVIYRVDGSTGSLAIGPAKLKRLVGVTMHSKTVLVDDHWAWIGSVNMASRGLYTDVEHCIAFVDEGDAAVKEYRKKLWGHHFRHANVSDFEDMDAALHAWEPAWFTAGTAPVRPVRSDGVGPDYIEMVNISLLPSMPDMYKYETVLDPDSRDTDWSVP